MQDEQNIAAIIYFFIFSLTLITKDDFFSSFNQKENH